MVKSFDSMVSDAIKKRNEEDWVRWKAGEQKKADEAKKAQEKMARSVKYTFAVKAILKHTKDGIALDDIRPSREVLNRCALLFPPLAGLANGCRVDKIKRPKGNPVLINYANSEIARILKEIETCSTNVSENLDTLQGLGARLHHILKLFTEPV